MAKRLLVLLLFLGLSIPLCGTAKPNEKDDRPVVIRAGRLLDVGSGEVRTNVTILVRQGRIVAVGDPESRGLGTGLRLPADAEVIDLSQATVLPGLIDLHAHILLEPGDVMGSYIRRSSARKALDGLRHAQALLAAGFTTLRDPGDADAYYAAVEIRNAIQRGEFVGPRLLVAPHFLSPTGGHGDFNELAPDVVVLADGKIVDSPDAMRRTVREEIKYGADWIKLFATGGVLSAHDDPRVQAFTDEELRAAVEEAHRHGKKVAAHAHGAAGLKAAVRAGVDSIEHGALIDDEAIALLRERGTTLVPTLYVANFITEEGARRGIPEDRVAKARNLLPERDRALRAAFAAGVKVAFGTDTGVFPHGQGGREFAHLVRLGLTPLQAIRSATVVAAELLGLENEIGTIEAGKRADIIAVADNPLENIRTLEEVKFVMKDGRVIRNDF